MIFLITFYLINKYAKVELFYVSRFIAISINMKFDAKSNLSSLAFAGMITLVCAGYSHAQTEEDEASAQSHVSGFVTLGGTYHENPDVGIVFSGAQSKPAYRGLSTELDSVLGLQWDYKLTPTASVKLQAVARAGEEYRPNLRMAYAQQELGKNLSFRVGRMRSPLFFDSDTSEIGYANTMIRGPVPLYAGTSGGQIAHIDGLHLQWREPLRDYSLTVNAYWGGGQATHYDFTDAQVNKFLINASGLLNLSVGLTAGEYLFRYSHTKVANYTANTDPPYQLYESIATASTNFGRLATDFADSGLGAEAQAANEKAKLLSLYSKPFDGAQTYDSIGVSTTIAGFGISGEWTQLDADAIMIGKVQGYQLSVNYPLGVFTPYISIAHNRRISNWADANPITPTGLPLFEVLTIDAALTELGNRTAHISRILDSSMRSVTVGLRWDVAPSMAAKIQYDYLTTPGTETPGAFKVRSFPFDNAVQLVSVGFDVVF